MENTGKRGAEDMELILELLYESRKSYIEWKQIICAVFLALLFSGMYYYMSVHLLLFSFRQGLKYPKLTFNSSYSQG